MDEQFFEKILRRGLGDETINNVRIKSQVPAVGKGENFLSQLWRFTLDYSCRDKMAADVESGDSIGSMKERREMRLIVKCEPELRGACVSLIKDQDLFATETKVFGMILPEIERLVGRRLAPRCFNCQAAIENQSCIVLEDLVPLGFRTKDRQIGMPLAHVLMVLESIADFHAASVHQYENNPDIMKFFDTGIMSDKTPRNMFRVIEQTLRMVSDGCQDWPDPIYRKISKKLLALESKFVKEIVDVTKYDDTEFCVLNHGDCWTNNIMFRENKHGEPLQVMLIDFQMSVYTSPVIDLVYFLSVCPAIDIKTDKDDIFLGKYLERLTERMRLLGCKTRPPTIAELQVAILKRRMWVVMSALTFYPRMIADAFEVETFDDIIESGVTRMNIFKNPNATIALQKSLSFMEKRGYLD